MFRLAIVLFGLLVVSCGRAPTQTVVGSDRPMRIVSLDYCADQYVLKLADPDQILAVSPDSQKPFSYMREAAGGVPTVRSVAEDVLILKPDLVVRSYGGGPNATAFFERAGVPVLQVGWASSLDGDGVGSIPDVLQQMADGLGQSARGVTLVEEYRVRLSSIRATASNKTAMYMTPAGVTTGPGSLVHEMLEAAGLENFQSERGWRSLPLERLAYDQPDIVAAAFFEGPDDTLNVWSPSKHPVAQKLLSNQDVVPLSGASTACASWFLVDTIDALALGARQ